MRTFFSISLLLLSFVAGIAQSSQTIEGNLIWDAEPTLFNPIPSVSHTIWAFEGASYDSKHPSLPYFLKRFPVNGNGTLTVDVIQANYEAFDKAPDADDYMLSEELQFVTEINKDRQQHVGKVYFIPIRKIGNQYERLTSFRLAIRYTPGNNTFASNRFGNTFNSVLSDGAIYKFGTTTEGVYKLDYNFLKNDLGISDLDNIDPRKIKLYGNNGGALPEANNIERVDDLHENKILIIGEGDGSFDAGDYILLYSQGAHVWQYDSDTDYFSQQRNPFDNEHYYFLKISEEDGYRVSLQNSISNTSYTSNTFDDYIRYEEDIFNLLNEAAGHQGSGRNWYGDIYNPTRERTFDNVFNFPNISNESVELKVAFAGRSKTSSSKVHAKVAGQDFIGDISKVTGEYSSWARVAIIDETFVSSDDNISITIDYPAVGSATNDGWLDYIEMNARRALTMVGDQMIFSDPKTLAYPNTTFQLANANNNLNIWDISDPLEVKEQEKNVSGNQASFGINTTSLKRFVAFNPNGTLNEPIAVGKIDNQNIHETDNVDMVIIYHPDFLAAAQKLKAHREEFSNLDVALIQIDDIFNEFSSGSLDPTAIRDFTKMVYERNADRFKYLLLFGDGSFDYKNINNGGKNFIPVYETAQSLGPISAFLLMTFLPY